MLNITQRFTTAATTASRFIAPRCNPLHYTKRFQNNYEIEASDLKRGIMIEYKGKLLETMKVEHQKVAMRGGFILGDFKNALDGTKNSYKFRSGETLEGVELERKFYKYAEKTKEGVVFNYVDDDEAEPLTVADVKSLGVYGHYLDYFPADTAYSFYEYNDRIIDFKGPAEVVMTIDAIQDLQNSLVLGFANGRTCKGPNHLSKGVKVVIRLPDEQYVSKA
eukprot:gene7617-8911_t